MIPAIAQIVAWLIGLFAATKLGARLQVGSWDAHSVAYASISVCCWAGNKIIHYKWVIPKALKHERERTKKIVGGLLDMQTARRKAEPHLPTPKPHNN